MDSDIAASYPFDDPVGMVLNDEGKLIGLDPNRSLWYEHGDIYEIVAGSFLVAGLGLESFAFLPQTCSRSIPSNSSARYCLQHQWATRVRSRAAEKTAAHGENDPIGQL